MTKNVSRILQIDFLQYWIWRFDLVFCNEIAIDGADHQPSGLNEQRLLHLFCDKILVEWNKDGSDVNATWCQN